MTPRKNKKKQAEVNRLLKEKGEKALETARKSILEENKRIECKEVGDAIQYFANVYWNDLVSPTLISLGCEAVGGDAENTLAIAAPMIFISGAVDIHDDIIDKSKTKYNRPTVFGKYGKEIALLVGDALLFKGLTLLQDVARYYPRERFQNIMNVIKNTFFELGDAEASELRFKGNLQITPQEYLATLQRKAADVEGLLRIGAIIGGGSVKKIEALACYGRIFGLLAILRDDWIDMMEDKELIHRARFETLPLLLLYALQNQNAEKKIRQILEKSKLTRQDYEKLLEITEKSGGFEETKKVMEGLTDKALSRLRRANIKNNQLELLLRFLGDLE